MATEIIRYLELLGAMRNSMFNSLGIPEHRMGERGSLLPEIRKMPMDESAILFHAINQAKKKWKKKHPRKIGCKISKKTKFFRKKLCTSQ